MLTLLTHDDFVFLMSHRNAHYQSYQNSPTAKLDKLNNLKYVFFAALSGLEGTCAL